jgi:hypothetical protein
MMRRLAVNAIAVGTTLFLATIILIVLSSVPYNSSVYAFLFIRLFVPNLIALALAVLVIAHFGRGVATHFQTATVMFKETNTAPSSPTDSQSPMSTPSVASGVIDL